MQLFFHDVGLQGADRDFPKTVFGDIAIDEIVSRVPKHLKAEVEERLNEEFPDGFCNAWGVPDGAKAVIKNLSYDDVMLLIRTTGGKGEMPALCQVKGFWREHLPELSEFLWGSNHFPYVFFFKTQKIDLTWHQFKQDVSYLPKFRPSGSVYRVREDRLVPFDGAEGYVSQLLGMTYPASPIPDEGVEEPTPEVEYKEGQRHAKEVFYFKRNPKLVKEAKEKYGYICQACGFDFEKVYGELGSKYIECHHKNPLSERNDKLASTIDDVCVLCSNCHRMIHRTKPAMSLSELKKIVRQHIIRKEAWE